MNTQKRRRVSSLQVWHRYAATCCILFPGSLPDLFEMLLCRFPPADILPKPHNDCDSSQTKFNRGFTSLSSPCTSSQVAEATDLGEKPTHPSFRREFPAPPEEFQGRPRPEGIHDPFSMFWVCTGPSSQLDMLKKKKTPKEGDHKAS